MGIDETERVHAANLEKVDHIVILMLESRSFDHMLGYLSLAGRAPTSTVSVLDSPTSTRGAPTRFTTSARQPWI